MSRAMFPDWRRNRARKIAVLDLGDVIAGPDRLAVEREDELFALVPRQQAQEDAGCDVSRGRGSLGQGLGKDIHRGYPQFNSS